MRKSQKRKHEPSERGSSGRTKETQEEDTKGGWPALPNGTQKMAVGFGSETDCYSGGSPVCGTAGVTHYGKRNGTVATRQDRHPKLC